MRPTSSGELITNSGEIIELNVGGFAYTTSRSTIMSFPDTMLCKMISGQLANALDTKQRIFIDRDGPLFRYILNFLRDKRLNLPDNFTEYAQLRQEADFYRIEPILTYLDCVYGNNKLNNSSRSVSMNSLVSSSAETILLASNNNKPLYFTIISKLHQGSIDSIIGSIRILSIFSSLDPNSKRFMSNLVNHGNSGGGSSSSSSNNSQSSSINPHLLNAFVCEFRFMHEEKLICCKPCGLNSSTDIHLVNLCQAVVKLAKKYGMATGYWDDMFYLSLESSVTNREQLCSILGEKSNGKLLSSCICDRRLAYDENNPSVLIERWTVMSSDLIASTTSKNN